MSARSMTASAATSAWQFAMAFMLSAVASAILPFLITPVVIAATGRREAGMALGVPMGLMLGWLLFPLIAWRPLRAVHLLALPFVAMLVVAAVALLPEHWLTSREGDMYGVYGAILNVMLGALVGYGALTWIRNIVVRAGAG